LLFWICLMTDSESDRLFMEDLYEQYHRLMYAQALQVLRQSQAAEDAVSESLIALMKKISLLRGLDRNKLRSYVVITVRNLSITHLNRGRRERPTDTVTMEELAGGRPMDERLLEQAGVERIKNAILALPPQQKDVMLMRYFREMSDEEIAREMGLKPVSVRVQLSRARKRLAQLLSGREEQP